MKYALRRVLVTVPLLLAVSLVVFALTDALPGASAVLFVGLADLFAPLKGGVLVPDPLVTVPGLPVDGSGELVLRLSLSLSAPLGLDLFFQHWILDPRATQGLAASNGLVGRVLP